MEKVGEKSMRENLRKTHKNNNKKTNKNQKEIIAKTHFVRNKTKAKKRVFGTFGSFCIIYINNSHSICLLIWHAHSNIWCET